MNKQEIFNICRYDIQLYNSCLYLVSNMNEIDNCEQLLSNVQKCMYEKREVSKKWKIHNKHIILKTNTLQ